jgi:HEAT repeat protein
MGTAAKPAIASLERALHDSHSVVARQAAVALGHVGKDAVSSLIQTLSAKKPQVRWNAILALEQMGPEAKEAIPPLTKMLSSSEAFLRWEAAAALGRIGSSAKSAVPTLTKLVGDSDPVVRRNAAKALGEIGPAAKSAFDALLQANQKDRDADVQDAAAEALWQIDPKEAKKSGVP